MRKTTFTRSLLVAALAFGAGSAAWADGLTINKIGQPVISVEDIIDDGLYILVSNAGGHESGGYVTCSSSTGRIATAGTDNTPPATSTSGDGIVLKVDVISTNDDGTKTCTFQFADKDYYIANEGAYSNFSGTKGVPLYATTDDSKIRFKVKGKQTSDSQAGGKTGLQIISETTNEAAGQKRNLHVGNPTPDSNSGTDAPGKGVVFSSKFAAFSLYPVNETADRSDAWATVSAYRSTVGCVGGVTQEVYTQNANGLSIGSETSALQTAAKALDEAAKIALDPSGLYRIVSAYNGFGTAHALYYNVGEIHDNCGTIYCSALDMGNADYVFQFKKATNEDEYDIYIPNSGLCIKGAGGWTIAEGSVPANNRTTLSSVAPGVWTITMGNSKSICCNTGDNAAIKGGNAGAAGSVSSWYIVPAESYKVTMNKVDEGASESWASLYLPFAVDMPEGVTAYTGQTDAQMATVTLNAVKTVPAHTGVVLCGSADSYELPISKSTAEAPSNNAFSGTDQPKTIEEGQTYYVLGVASGAVGFYKPSNGTTQLAADKAINDRDLTHVLDYLRR